MELKDITKESVNISEYTTLGEALDLMLTEHTNTLLVTNDDGKLVGEVSVADFFDGIIPPHLDGDRVLDVLNDEASFAAALQDACKTPVSEFMSVDFDSVRPDSNIIEVAAIAISHARARIPVVDHDDRPIGIISRQGLKQILGRFLHSGLG